MAPVAVVPDVHVLSSFLVEGSCDLARASSRVMRRGARSGALISPLNVHSSLFAAHSSLRTRTVHGIPASSYQLTAHQHTSAQSTPAHGSQLTPHGTRHTAHSAPLAQHTAHSIKASHAPVLKTTKRYKLRRIYLPSIFSDLGANRRHPPHFSLRVCERGRISDLVYIAEISHISQISDLRSQISDLRSQTSQTSDFRSQISDLGPQIRPQISPKIFANLRSDPTDLRSKISDPTPREGARRQIV